jgi:precorrin-3B synthase
VQLFSFGSGLDSWHPPKNGCVADAYPMAPVLLILGVLVGSHAVAHLESAWRRLDTVAQKREFGSMLCPVSSGASSQGDRPRQQSDGPASGSPLNPIEVLKARKHGFDVWPDFLQWSDASTSYDKIDEDELQRLKWYGIFWRKHDHNRYMLRVRIPACEMTFAQARALAFTAYEAGHEIVDLTTRGNVQIQGLTIEKIPKVIAALERCGLTTKQTGLDNIRNITSHPLAGVDLDELIDTREAARAVTGLFIDNRELADLPRKFNIGFNGRGDTSPLDWTQDIAWLAAYGPDGSVGYRLLIGGMQGPAPHLGWHLPVFVRPEEVCEVTLAILHLYRERGSRSDRRNHVRFRYLIEKLGAEGALEEIEGRIGHDLVRYAEPPPPPKQLESFIGWFPQRQPGRWAVGIAAPMGRLTWRQFEGIAILARDYGDGTVRTATDQNLVLPGVRGDDRAALGLGLASLGLAFDADTLTRQIVACTGKQFCNLALTEAKSYGLRMLEDLRRRQLQLYGIRIAISGCANACAQHHTADIGLRGVRVRQGLRAVDAFDIYLGGGVSKTFMLARLHQKGVPVERIADTLERIVLEFYSNRQNEECFSSYWQRVLAEREPEVVFPEVVPTWQCSTCGYEYVGAAPPGFCPQCAAVKSKFALLSALDSSG